MVQEVKSQAKYNLGKLYLAQGKEPEAIKEFEAAMLLQEDKSQSILELADLMFRNEQYIEASKYYLELKVYKRVKECFELAIPKSETNKEYQTRIAYAKVLEEI